MKKKSVLGDVIKFVLIFFILTIVWLFVFAAINNDPSSVDYEPFPGASFVFAFITTLIWVSLSNYNYLQQCKQSVDAAYHNIKAQIDKRDALLGKANDIVGGYMRHEEAVYSSRKELDYTNIAILVESYPELKANQSVMELLKQIDTCENEIALRKETYNNLVNQFNSTIHSFPVNLVSNMFRFNDALYYDKRKELEK